MGGRIGTGSGRVPGKRFVVLSEAEGSWVWFWLLAVAGVRVAAGSAGISITAVESSDSGGSPLLQQGEVALEGSGSELSLFSSFGASAPDSSAKAPENNNEDATFSSAEALLLPC